MRQMTAVITGSPGLLAAHIVADMLSRSQVVGVVASPAPFARFVSLLRRLPFGEDKKDLAERLRRLQNLDAAAGVAVWHFAPPGQAMACAWLEELQNAAISALNVVSTPYCGGQRWRWLLAPEEPADIADPHAFEFPVIRTFQITLTIGAAPVDDIAQEGVLHFLATLFDLKTEIEEREPHFFEYRSLRCAITPDASVNVLRVEDAAAMILSIADRAGSGDYVVASAGSFTAEEFLERVGEAYGVSLLASERAAQRTSAPSQLDSLFDLRLNNFATHLAEPKPQMVDETWRAANMSPAHFTLDAASLDHLIEQTYRQQSSELHTVATRVAAMANNQVIRQASRDGQEFTYRCAGEAGEVVVLLNAFGQGPESWSRLTEHLRPRFRVLSWNLRGLEDIEQPKSIPDHVADLATIVDQEAADKVHLIAWCTGPKIAVEFAARHPDRVRSLIFLNTTMKCVGSPPALDTPYERNFESLCRVLEQRPLMAGSIVDSLMASGGDTDTNLRDERDADASATVLATINRDLQKSVLRPFRDPGSGLRYVRQLIDFWSHDVRNVAARIDIPVLLFASEYDRVATPEASEWASRMFPRARLLRAQGATHYFLYDRADVVARMVEWFISTLEAPQVGVLSCNSATRPGVSATIGDNSPAAS